ncbi:MAG: zinc ribbon domain-containing protein, partial [Pseudorhodoplanes sp.]|nr:zinc ribbon domain-containing protein [Pseudorhodoplanes sp.]
MAYCRACGRAIEANARFCRQCGATIANHEPAARDAIAPVPDVQPPMPQAGPLGRIRLVLANPEMLKAVSKAAGKSMALSAAVLGPGLLLLALGQVVLGTIWLFAGSFAMVAWTYRKPWRLGLVSCLIPPVAAGLCYIVQLILFANANLPFLLVLGGILAGCAAGWIRAQTHEVYLENGQYFAQRSIAYLAIWAAAFGITQLLGLLASNVWLIRAGLVTGAFSTAMLALVSIVVWRKRARVGAQTVVLLLAVAAIMAPSPLYAQFASDRASARDLLADAASRVVLHSNPGQVFPLGAPQISGSNDLATATYRTQIGIAYYHFVVILSRHANATAAQPAAGDLRNIPVVARRVFEGASVVLSGHVAGGPGPGRRVAQTAGATARENFKIVTHADASYTNTGSPGGRTALGSST